MTSRPQIECARTAARQHGVITRQQAITHGMTKRMIGHCLSTGDWQRLYPSTYIPGGVPITWLSKMAGAVLAGGRGAGASHRAAAHLLGLDGFRQDVVEMSAPRRIRWEGVIAHQSEPIGGSDLTKIQDIPTTSATRTLLDLGAVVDLKRLLAALDSALLAGKTSVPYLMRRLEERTKRPRSAVPLLRLLELRRSDQPPTESELERMFHRKVTTGFRLPVPEFQCMVNGNGFSYRIDFAYPAIRLGIEVLGASAHLMSETWRRDQIRHNKLTNSGWEILYFTWLDVVERPAQVAQEIKLAIARKTELFTPA